MILASCPRCSETVRFPETELPSDAQAKCPWCQESCSAKDWSAQLPPMVDLFDGAGIPIEMMAVAATGASLAATRVFDDEPPANQVDMAEVAMVEVELDEVELDEVDELHDADQDPLDQVSEFKPVSDFEDDVASTVINPSAETWTDDDEPTQHHLAAQDTVAIEEAAQENQENGFEILDEDVEADDEDSDDYRNASDEAVSSTKDTSHDFRIEEDGPIRQRQHEALSPEPRAFDSVPASIGIAPMRVKSKSRVNAKRSNLRTWLGIALGPIIALPIAGLIFYVTGTNLGFWPLDGGQSAALSARAAKPMDLDHFDPNSKSDPIPASASESNDASESDMLPDAMPDAIDGASPQQMDSESDTPVTETEEVSLDRSFWAPPELAEKTGTTESKFTPDTDDKTSLSQPVAESAAEQAPEPSLELPMKSTPEIVSSSKPDQDKTSELEMPEPDISPALTPEPVPAVESPPSELSLAIADANEWLETLATLSQDSANWKGSLAKTYAAIAKIGDSEPLASDKDVLNMMTKLKTSAQLNDLAAATALWLVYAKRTNEGAMLVGRPGSGKNGPVITLSSGEEVSIRTDSVEIPTAEKIIALGRIEGQSPQLVVRIVAVQPAN